MQGPKPQRGFTMVELIVVMVVVGILATVVVGKMLDNQHYEVPAHAERLRSLLRYGQKIAVAQNRPVYIDVSNTKLLLCFDDNTSCTSPVLATGQANDGSSATLAACGSASAACTGHPSEISVVSTVAEFTFDAQGRPYADGQSLTATSTFTTATITLSGAKAGANQQVVIEADTGYVH